MILYDTFNFMVYIISNEIGKWKWMIGKDLQGDSCDLYEGIIPAQLLQYKTSSLEDLSQYSNHYFSRRSSGGYFIGISFSVTSHIGKWTLHMNDLYLKLFRIIIPILFRWNNGSFIRQKPPVLADISLRTPHLTGPECWTSNSASCWLWLLGLHWNRSFWTATSNLTFSHLNEML